MSIKISELPQASNVGSNDLVPIVQNGETKKALASDFGGGGTSDYTDLTNKPSINSVTLSGNKTSGDLNLVGTGDIATTIDSTSTNSEVAGAKAVYDATLHNYSTTEQVVGTWTDGKPLYEKVVSGTVAANSTIEIQMETNITMRKMNGIMLEGASLELCIPYYATSTDFTHIFYSRSSYKLFVKSGTTHGYGTFEIICQYTKTTDTV